MTARPLPGLAALGLLIGAATVAAQDRPLPDQATFLSETRKRFQTDGALQSSYVYAETRRNQKLDKGGRTRRSGTSEFSDYRQYSVDTVEGCTKPKP